jgi:sialate O-acetylesterase
MYNCPRVAYEGQKRNLPDSGYWFNDQDEALASFSAPAYHFARTLQPSLDIPIGIIGCNWGGTPARAWIDRTYLDTPDMRFYLEEYESHLASQDMAMLEKESMDSWAFEDSYHHQMEWRSVMYGINEAEQLEWIAQHKSDPVLPLGPYHHYRPCGLYETMIKKIAPFPIKGMLWYQGESDADHPDTYDKMLDTLIQCWRDTWKDETLPFLLVQLAPFQKWLECSGEAYPQLREKQDIASHTISNTYLTSIMDIGMYEDIHPKEKREVGRRLALLAQNHVYGMDCLSDPPEFVSASRESNVLRLTFANTGETLSLSGDTIQAMRVYQGGQSCTIQKCCIESDTILLYVDTLSSEPVDISYAEEAYCEVNLYNPAGIPAKPFHCTI